jgi:hypothetical protein
MRIKLICWKCHVPLFLIHKKYVRLNFNCSSFLANYMNSWKCVAVLKGDGTQTKSDSSTPAVPTPSGGVATSNHSSTTRYYKLGTISNPNQVPWHWDIFIEIQSSVTAEITGQFKWICFVFIMKGILLVSQFWRVTFRDLSELHQILGHASYFLYFYYVLYNLWTVKVLSNQK